MCRQLHTNYLPYIEVIAVCKTNEKKITCILPVVSANPVLISKRLKITQCPILSPNRLVLLLLHSYSIVLPSSLGIYLIRWINRIASAAIIVLLSLPIYPIYYHYYQHPIQKKNSRSLIKSTE